jgi:hypothetical protein
MADKNSLEQQVKALQRQMGGIAKLVKELKTTVENMQKENKVSENDEIQEIIDTQKVIDEIIVANSDCIRRIEKEIKAITVEKGDTKVLHDVLEKEVEKDTKVTKVRKICRYYNRGFCKYKNKCRFAHANKICKIYEETGTCGDNKCSDRHPKHCKWWESSRGCKREQECEYLHSENKKCVEEKHFKCESCKCIWQDRNCVVEHDIKNIKIFFCLNCEDWVKIKENVLNEGWTLFDEGGNLRMDV